MYQAIIVLHVLLGLGIIGFVMIQRGKGADAGAAFGSGGSGSVFGAQGASNFLSRTTAILATLFFSTSLGLAVLSGHQAEETDIMDKLSTEDAELPIVQDNSEIVDVVEDSIPVIDSSASEQIQSIESTVTEQMNQVSDTLDQTIETSSEAIENSMGEVMNSVDSVIQDSTESSQNTPDQVQ